MSVNPHPIPGKLDKKEALSTNKRSQHEFSRSTNFEHIVKAFDPPQKAPKCKVNLTPRLAHTVITAHTTHEPGNESSRSSLYSIPSLEWDGRCKSDFGMRSRSLPRYKPNKLFRTQSHSGFINSYIKDPEPTHYHLPRCRSCGATNVSYAFELTKREKPKKAKNPNSIYFSVDNIPQKCSEEAESDTTYVKVQEKFVPVFKVEKKETEFVESQEFNEDNYIGDIGNSFSSDNQTIIEKSDAVDPTVILDNKVTELSTKPTVKEEIETYTADLVNVDEIDDVNKTLDSIEGEYHSFTDLEDSYESPVKELVEKDIRDYSVPIDFYCDDFKTRDDAKKSPLKIKILEPILEESKSSYGDDSNVSQNDKKEELMEGIVGDVVNTAVLASHLKLEIATNATQKVTTECLVAECSRLESYSVNEGDSDITANDIESFTTNNVLTAIDVYENTTSEQDMVDIVYDNVFDILSSENPKCVSDATTVKRQNSLGSTLSSNERCSFDSTAEFEKYEVVSEVLSAIINRIDFIDLEVKPKLATSIEIIEEDFVTYDVNETFSIAKIIEDIEQNVCLNETVLTEVSETDIGVANKVIESILYYIFDRAMFINHQKEKGSKKNVKRVVTVADFEDILFTAKPLWMEANDPNDIEHVEEEINEEIDFSTIKDFFNAKCLENVEDNNTNIVRVNIEYKNTDKVPDSKEIETIYSAKVRYEDSTEINYSKKDHVQQEHGLDELKTGNIHFLVNNLENLERTEHHNQIEAYQESIPKEINKHTSKVAYSNITEEFSLANDLKRVTDTEHVLNETFVESSDMNNAFHEDFSQSEDPTMSSHTEDVFATPDVDLTAEIKENISLEPEAIIRENVTDLSQEEYHSSVIDDFKDISDRTEEFTSFSAQSNVTNIEEYLSPIKEFPSADEEPVFSPKYRDISHKSLAEVRQKEISRKRKHGSVKEAQSRSSSPNRKTTKKFELTESPIKSFSKESPCKSSSNRRSDMSSPFMRKANVLAMSQTEHSGGVKYWLSFDEHIPLDHDKHIVRSVKSIDDTLPSFISIDLDENIEGKSNEFYDKETKKTAKRTSVLLNEFSGTVSMPAPSVSGIEYGLVEDPNLVQSESTEPQKRLLYELHSKPTHRKYSSWPPFEDTLFYRIISKFRMSESFDPSDLEHPNFDSNSFDEK